MNRCPHQEPATAHVPSGERIGEPELVIGVLALQGDFHAHGRRLEQLGVSWKRVRQPGDLAGTAGLILPGGESTTLLRLLAWSELDTAVVEYARRGFPLFGTCAGLIVLATEVLNPRQPSLGLLDVTVQRNAYGRQIDSFETRGRWAPSGQQEQEIEMVFIRAPRIVSVRPSATPIAWCGDEVVAVQQGQILGATFHPELGAETTVHQYFVELCKSAAATRSEPETSETVAG